jgi:thiol-disulfide isomerase/thioredoxin
MCAIENHVAGAVEIIRCRLVRLLLVCGLLLLAAVPAAAELREGMPAPAIRAELLDGARFDSARHAGKVIVLNFWASWCKPCREEMPALDAYYRAHRVEGLEMIAISVEDPDDIAKVRRVMKDFSFPAALASAARTEGYGRLWRLPVTFVIDRRGVLRFDGLKYAKVMDLPALERIVTPLLRATKGAIVAEAAAAQ